MASRILPRVTSLGSLLRNSSVRGRPAFCSALQPAVTRSLAVACRSSFGAYRGLATKATKATTKTKKPAGKKVVKKAAGKSKAKSSAAAAAAAARKPKGKSPAKPAKKKASGRTKAKLAKAGKGNTRPPLTAEEKAGKFLLRKQKERELQIKQMKATALPRAPRTRPMSSFNVFVKERTEGQGELVNIAKLTDEWKQLPADRKAAYETKKTSQNEDRALAYKRFIDRFSVSDIIKANRARIWLKRHDIARVDVTRLKDHRKPKGRKSAFCCFVSERHGSMVDAAAKWKAMTEEEKKTYEEISKIDAERYEHEMKMALGPSVVGLKSGAEQK